MKSLHQCAVAAILLAAPLPVHVDGAMKRPTLPIRAEELASFVDPIITAQMEKEHIPGAVFVLVQDGKILYKRGYGFADLAAKRPLDPDETIWRIGSSSRVFTATAVVQLADRGRFRLTDDVNQPILSFVRRKSPGLFQNRSEILPWWSPVHHRKPFSLR